MSISTLLFLFCALGYLWVSWSLAGKLFFGRGSRASTVLAIGSLAALAHILGALLQMHGANGTDFSLLRSLNLILAVTTLMVVVSSEFRPTRPLLLLLAPLSLVAILASSLSPASAAPLQLSLGEATHISLSILAFGLLSMATVEALLLKFVSARLKEHRLNALLRHMPPMEALEKLMFDLLRVGTLLLAAAVATGLMFLQSFAEQHLYHKFFFSVVAVVLYSWLWWGHARYGWRGKSALRWTLGAYVSLVLAYAGTKIVLEWIVR